MSEQETTNAGPGSLTEAELAVIEFANAATVCSSSETIARLTTEVRRLRAQVADYQRWGIDAWIIRPTWTKEPPTEPGWYFHRTGPAAVDPPTACEITFQSADPTVPTIWNCGEPDTITGWGGEWAGPLVPPGEKR